MNPHGAMDRHLLQVHVHGQTESEAENTDHDAKQEQIVTVHSVEEGHLR